MGISWVYFNNFTIYISQIIMMYALNLYSDACQLFLNKMEKIERLIFMFGS